MKEIWQFDLTRGNSDDPRNGACLLDAVSWFQYGKLGDHPACVCPVLAAYGRKLNDILPHNRRQELKPFIIRLIDTVDPTSAVPRATYLALAAIRAFAPSALDALAITHPRHAIYLRRNAEDLRKQETLIKAIKAIKAVKAASSAIGAIKDAEDAAKAALAAATTTDGASRADWVVLAAKEAAGTVTSAARTFASAGEIVAGNTAFAAANGIYDQAIAAFEGALEIGRRGEGMTLPRIEHANRSFEMARQ
jgi:tetratricopeptide (TPR) repeat protein